MCPLCAGGRLPFRKLGRGIICYDQQYPSSVTELRLQHKQGLFDDFFGLFSNRLMQMSTRAGLSAIAMRYD
jgi:hypothetical protein